MHVGTAAGDAVTAGTLGWVAVGSATPVANPASEVHVAAAWVSTDGQAWTRASTVAMPAGARHGEMSAVTRSAGSLFAAGTANLTDGTVWRSVDGTTWDIIGSGPDFDLGPCIEGCARLISISARPDGVVVTGYRVVDSGAGVRAETDLWTSTDGSAWRRTPLKVPEAQGTVAAEAWVAADDRGFVVAGTICEQEGRICRAVAWTSGDGRSWTAPVDLPNGAGARVVRVATGPRATVILGQRCDTDPCRFAVWAAADGARWVEGALDGANAIASSNGLLAAAGDRFVVLGSKGGVASAWTSSNGVAWERDALSHAFPPLTAMLVVDIAGRPGRALAIGLSGEPETPTTWVSP